MDPRERTTGWDAAHSTLQAQDASAGRDRPLRSGRLGPRVLDRSLSRVSCQQTLFEHLQGCRILYICYMQRSGNTSVNKRGKKSTDLLEIDPDFYVHSFYVRLSAKVSGPNWSSLSWDYKELWTSFKNLFLSPQSWLSRLLSHCKLRKAVWPLCSKEF